MLAGITRQTPQFFISYFNSGWVFPVSNIWDVWTSYEVDVCSVTKQTVGKA